MKHYLLIFALFMLLLSCSDEKKSTDKKTIKKSSEENIVKGEMKSLLYNYQKGQTFKYKLNTITSNSQTIKADTTITASMLQDANYVINFKVIDVDKNNIATISLTPVSIYVKSIINGQKAIYDSRIIYSNRERAMFADYEALKNKPFKVKVTNNGEVTEIFDVDKIINQIFVLQGIQDSVTAEQKKMFKQNYIFSGLAPIVEQLFRNVTKDKVGINSHWEQKYPSTFGAFNITNTATYKVLEFKKENEDSIAKISANLSISWTGSNTATEQGVTYTFSNPDVSGNGEIFYNLSKHLVEHSKTKIISVVELKMSSPETQNKVKEISKKERMEITNILELL